MTKRGAFYLIGILIALVFGGWFLYEEYWKYRVKEGAKALGYELNDVAYLLKLLVQERMETG